MSRANHYVGVPIPSVVYVGCPDRAEFDKIGVEATDHGLDEHGSHLLTKVVEGPGKEAGRPVKVIFQCWIAEEPLDKWMARKQAEAEARRMAEAAKLIVENARCSFCGAKLDGTDECGLANCPHTKGSRNV